VQTLSVPHTLPSVVSVSVDLLLSSTDCALSLSTSHFTVHCFCVTVSTAVFYSRSIVSHYHTLYRLLFLCHCIHCCRLQSALFLSVPHTVMSVVSVSLYQLVYSFVCQCASGHNFIICFSVFLYPLRSSTVFSRTLFTSQCTIC